MEFTTKEQMLDFVLRTKKFIDMLLKQENEKRKKSKYIDFKTLESDIYLAISSKPKQQPLVIQVLDDGLSAHLEVKYLKKQLAIYGLKSPYRDWGYQNLAGAIAIQPEYFERLSEFIGWNGDH